MIGLEKLNKTDFIKLKTCKKMLTEKEEKWLFYYDAKDVQRKHILL